MNSTSVRSTTISPTDHSIIADIESIERLLERGTHCYVHAGSSSEYGAQAAAPDETVAPAPNSHYAVTKNAAAGLVHYAGHHRGLRCANLRLYSVYGPLEDRSRLIPTLVAHAAQRRLPPFVDPDTARDFLYIDDAVRAFLCAAVLLRPDHYGASFNVGSGRKTTIRELAYLAKREFGLEAEPEFSTMSARTLGTLRSELRTCIMALTSCPAALRRPRGR